jgi:transposase InsO family protein
MRCREAGVRPSTGSVGDAYDNAMAEALDRKGQVTDERDCFEVERLIAEIDAELAARKAASGGRDGT